MTAGEGIGDLLAAHLDSMQADLQARALPFAEALDMREQRDRARRIAVGLEQECAALAEQITTARDWLAGVPCECRNRAAWDGAVDVEPCDRCIVLAYLAPRPTDPSAFLLMGGE